MFLGLHCLLLKLLLDSLILLQIFKMALMLLICCQLLSQFTCKNLALFVYASVQVFNVVFFNYVCKSLLGALGGQDLLYYNIFGKSLKASLVDLSGSGPMVINFVRLHIAYMIAEVRAPGVLKGL